jgi:hypothetical protein
MKIDIKQFNQDMADIQKTVRDSVPMAKIVKTAMLALIEIRDLSDNKKAATIAADTLKDIEKIAEDLTDY